MTDMRTWNRELVADLISMYKSLPALWKIKSDEYKNRRLKKESYEKLVKFCQKNGFPEADREFVTKKVQSLRTCYRKELRKVMESQRGDKGTSEAYVPLLWYYDQFRFLEDQESHENGAFRVVDTEDFCNGDYTNQSNYINEEDSDESGPGDPELEEPIFDDDYVPLQNSKNTSTIYKNTRKRKESFDNQAELLKVCVGFVKKLTKETTEFELVGKNVANKLNRMDHIQAVYAESLIMDILRLGVFNRLTELTEVNERR